MEDRTPADAAPGSDGGSTRPGPETPKSAAAPAEAAPLWYVTLHGQAYGPVNAETLRQWARQGRISADLQVCPAGGGAWALYTVVPELRDLPVVAPPPTPPPTATMPATAPPSGISPCPRCDGPVTNVAPTYGWPWGLWQRSLKPTFQCSSCRADVGYDGLTPAAQAKVTRTMRNAFILWIVVVVLVFGGIASPFIMWAIYF